jgi:hypothetical protein
MSIGRATLAAGASCGATMVSRTRWKVEWLEFCQGEGHLLEPSERSSVGEEGGAAHKVPMFRRCLIFGLSADTRVVALRFHPEH